MGSVVSCRIDGEKGSESALFVSPSDGGALAYGAADLGRDGLVETGVFIDLGKSWIAIVDRLSIAGLADGDVIGGVVDGFEHGAADDGVTLGTSLRGKDRHVGVIIGGDRDLWRGWLLPEGDELLRLAVLYDLINIEKLGRLK